MLPKLIVYRRDYALTSETFVSDHVATLQRFEPIVLTERNFYSQHRAAATCHRINESRLGRELFLRFGISPVAALAVRKYRPALIHAHFLTDAARILPFAKRHLLPLIVTAHGYDASLYDEALKEIPEGRLLLARRDRLKNYVSRIVCVSQVIRDELAARGYPSEKLKIIHLGVNTQALAPRAVGAVVRGIVSVGRLVEKKGMKYLIEAYAKLPAQLRAAEPLTIIGDGPLRALLEAQAKACGISVCFAGSQPRTEVLRRVLSARVFCLPSVRAADGDSEGMPISLMEALSLGVPITIFDDQPMSALLRSFDAGVTARHADSEDLGAKLAMLLTDNELAQRMSRSGRALCEAQFSLAANTRVLEDLYGEVAL